MFGSLCAPWKGKCTWTTNIWVGRFACLGFESVLLHAYGSLFVPWERKCTTNACVGPVSGISVLQPSCLLFSSWKGVGFVESLRLSVSRGTCYVSPCIIGVCVVMSRAVQVCRNNLIEGKKEDVDGLPSFIVWLYFHYVGQREKTADACTSPLLLHLDFHLPRGLCIVCFVEEDAVRADGVHLSRLLTLLYVESFPSLAKAGSVLSVFIWSWACFSLWLLVCSWSSFVCLWS